MLSPKMADSSVYSGYTLVYIGDDDSKPGFLLDHLSVVLTEEEAFYSYYGFLTEKEYFTTYYDINDSKDGVM
jgi:hypothetical protein